jgi:hypothetical protein
MMSRVFTALIASAALFLAGCASKPQLPVDLTPASLPASGHKIGVAMTKLPKPEVHLPGAGCLLCIIAATAMNSELSKHTDTLQQEDLPQLKEQLAALLRKRGATVSVIAEPFELKNLADAPTSDAPNVATKNFAPLKQKYGVDKLMVIDIQMLGFERPYASYIPTSDPKGVLRGTGYLINLSNNTYEWYRPVSIIKSAEGKWDEPTKFPGLTNAYFQALELGKDQFIKPLMAQ